MYICNKCGKVFKQKQILLIHEKSNCDDGPLFKCVHCAKSFSSKHVLKTHTRIHFSEKNLLCKYCGKSFHWKGQLKIHERSHTGERPFKCQVSSLYKYHFCVLQVQRPSKRIYIYIKIIFASFLYFLQFSVHQKGYIYAL